MNRTYALVWNHCLRTWSVACEYAKRRGKGSGAVLATALLLPAFASAADLPTGGQIVSGTGQISTPTSQQMLINQGGNTLAINCRASTSAAATR